MDEKLKDLVIEISEGNPGCITVLMNVFKTVGPERFEGFARGLKANGITGSLVWVKFKDELNQDIDAFIEAGESGGFGTMTDRRGLIADMKSR